MVGYVVDKYEVLFHGPWPLSDLNFLIVGTRSLLLHVGRRGIRELRWIRVGSEQEEGKVVDLYNGTVECDLHMRPEMAKTAH